MSSASLTYPLTKKALQAAFASLQPQEVRVTKQPGWHEACVDGAWSLAKLRQAFRALGFKPTGNAEALLFVNSDKTVGLQCFGVEPHPTKNTWKSYCFEVQARSKAS